MARLAKRALTVGACLAMVVPLGTSHSVASAAGTASPSIVSVDCDVAGGVTATTITGEVGDAMTIDNTAATTGSCTFGTLTGVVTATNLSSSTLAPGQTSVITIVAAGTFTVTATGGSPVTMTVVIGTPITVPEYVISFDGNGGECDTNPIVVTGAAGDWFAMPGEGSCRRQAYGLMGWARAPGDPGAEFPPGAPGRFADHETFYAVWRPTGVELTFDANVAVDDLCLDADGRFVPESGRTTTVVWGIDEGFLLPTQAPCAPPGHTLIGWAKTGDGLPVYSPGELNGTVGLAPGTAITLFAVWRPDFSVLMAEQPAQPVQSCSYDEFSTTIPVQVTPMSAYSQSHLADFAELGQEITAEVTVSCGDTGTDPSVSVLVNWPLAEHVDIGPLTLDDATDGATSSGPTAPSVFSAALTVHGRLFRRAVLWGQAAVGNPDAFTVSLVLDVSGSFGTDRLPSPVEYAINGSQVISTP